jgi:chromate transporter
MSDHAKTPTACADIQAPQSKADLFWSFTFLALQGFGGVLTVVQRELVDKKRWMTLDEFVEDWAVAQMLPGPNVVNLCMMFGGRHFGIWGALSALAGLLLAPLTLVLLLAAVFSGIADTPVAQGMLRGMGAVSAGLIVAVGLKMLPAMRSNPMGQAACSALLVLTFIAVGWLRLPLAWVLLGLGPLATLWAAHCLRRRAQDQGAA